MKFRRAKEVERIAEELIQAHHQHLINVPIRYIMLDETPVSKGKEVWGRARKVTGLNAFLAQMDSTDFDAGEVADDQFFVIEIAEPKWLWMSEKQQRALVDHELCHCQTDYDDDGELKLLLQPHDVEEFSAVVKRHGLWRIDLENFVTAAKQLELFKPPEKVESVTISNKRTGRVSKSVTLKGKGKPEVGGAA